MITSIDQLDFSKAYTFKDYLSWKFTERVELLKGYIARMSPAATSKHQEISSNLHFSLAYFLQKKTYKVIAAPFDVYLPSIKGDGETVVQPDLCVICDTSKIKKQGCVGSPDLVIEVLSLGNSRKEMGIKYQIYEQAGVKEYSVVFPYEQVIQQYILQDGKFQIFPLSENNVKSIVLEGFEVDMDAIFDTIGE
ncbi:Uma2 family endonuclease [Emticicia sp. SJ17W-69]|uniref:Uma2 family endonuclease n=1 Tax=Emticicia sp. SJ17W-69 TaxID=3421657 RepID=UPI003EBBE9A1